MHVEGGNSFLIDEKMKKKIDKKKFEKNYEIAINLPTLVKDRQPDILL